MVPFIPVWFAKPIKVIISAIVGFVAGVIAATFLRSDPEEYRIRLKPDSLIDGNELKSNRLYLFLDNNILKYAVRNDDGNIKSVVLQAADEEGTNTEEDKTASLKRIDAQKKLLEKIKSRLKQGNKEHKLSWEEQKLLFEMTSKEGHKAYHKPSLFFLGRDGWSKYVKAGLPLGIAIGAAIGALIGFLTPIPGGMAAGMAIGGALGGVTGVLSFAVFVPLINKIRRHFNPNYIPSDAVDKNAETIPFRTNYLRVGTTFGTYLGLIIGFIIGLVLPFPGAALLLSTIGAGIGAGIGAVAGGIIGPMISNTIKDRSSSSWDYGARTGAMLGNQYGVGSIFTGFFSIFGIGSEIKMLKDIIFAAAGIIAGIIGGIHDAWCSYANRHKSPKEIENERPVLPWSQRVATFAIIGGFIGGIVGFIIGTCVAGPIGGAAGMAIGTGAAGLISAVISAQWGDQIVLAFTSACAKLSNYIQRKAEEYGEVNVPLVKNSQRKIQGDLKASEVGGLRRGASNPPYRDQPSQEEEHSDSSSENEFNLPTTSKCVSNLRRHSLLAAPGSNHRTPDIESTALRSRALTV